jgi:hypothetical protein
MTRQVSGPVKESSRSQGNIKLVSKIVVSSLGIFRVGWGFPRPPPSLEERLMLKTLAFAIAIAALAAAASAPAQAKLSANGTSLNGTTAGAAPTGQIVGIELPARTGEAQ